MNCILFPPLSIYEIGQRENQEDAIAQWNNRLFVLCDGMGGHEHGEVASQTVCKAIASWFDAHVNPEELFTDDLLKEAIEYAYIQLDRYADDSLRQMGTTLTLLYIHKQGVTAAHIGDSRIYHIRPGVGILYQSRDHSLVYDLYQAGEITYEEIATFPQKNVITRAMTPGEDNRHRPDIIHITEIQFGDYFYLCSDGMLEQMDNDELVDLLSSQLTDEEKRSQLIELTYDNKDNHSAWIIHIKDVIKEEGDERLVNEEPTARCNALNIKLQPSKTEDVQIVDKNDVQIVDENDVKVVDENDVEIAEAEDVVIDDDDVVVVSVPQKPKRKQIPFLKLFIAAILCIILIAAYFVLYGNEDKEDEEIDSTEMIMPKPITPFHH